MTIVDDDVYQWASKLKWHAAHYRGSWRAQRKVKVDGKQRTELLHRIIIGTVGKETDHIDGDGLNNQRSNLRVCTHGQNMRNRKVQCNNQSGVKGVTFEKNSNKWQTRICIEDQRIYLGTFTCLEDAAKAYDAAAVKYHGQFARTNFQ